MKKPFVLIAAMVAVVGLGAVAAVAKNTTRVATSLSVKHTQGTSWYSGRVKANKGCEKQRKVILVDPHSAAGWHGDDRTNNHGRYRIFDHDPGGGIRSWVVVQEKSIKDDGEKISCLYKYVSVKRR